MPKLNARLGIRFANNLVFKICPSACKRVKKKDGQTVILSLLVHPWLFC